MKNEWNNGKGACMHPWISHSSGRGSASAQRIAPKGLALVLVVSVLLTSVLFYRPAMGHTQARQNETAGQQNSTTVPGSHPQILFLSPLSMVPSAPGHLELSALGLAPPIVDD